VAAIVARNDDIAFEVGDGQPQPRFAWSANVAGAVAALAATALLLLLGAGIGVTLVSREPPSGGASLTVLGVVYYFSAFIFGFAVGGHVAGRMIGPRLESATEDTFRPAAHGLVTWSLAALVWISAFALLRGGSADLILRLDPLGAVPHTGEPDTSLPSSSYWEDVLFRPQALNGRHASLAGLQFAQADIGQSTDAAPVPPASDSSQPTQSAPDQGATEGEPGSLLPPTPNENPQPSRQVIRHVPGDLAPATLPPSPPTPANLGADKTEVGHILEADLSTGGYLSVDDRDRVAQLVAQDANLSYETATTRVNDVQGRIHNLKGSRDADNETAERYSTLVLGIALLLGAVVSVIAAISAGRENALRSAFSLLRGRN
jgi:hypothetical protein